MKWLGSKVIVHAGRKPRESAKPAILSRIGTRARLFQPRRETNPANRNRKPKPRLYGIAVKSRDLASLRPCISPTVSECTLSSQELCCFRLPLQRLVCYTRCKPSERAWRRNPVLGGSTPFRTVWPPTRLTRLPFSRDRDARVGSLQHDALTVGYMDVFSDSWTAGRQH